MNQEANLEQSIKDLLSLIGEDPSRDGLLKTPARFIKAFKEMTQGYSIDPKTILSVVFENDEHYDEMVLLKDIEFNSLCEHHLLPFKGVAHVAYLPNKETGAIVGLSKLARLVDCFANRLQVQERMTQEIAKSLEANLNPAGVGVIIKAHHQCMSCRGVKKSNSTMVTSALLGEMREPEVRAEFLKLLE